MLYQFTGKRGRPKHYQGRPISKELRKALCKIINYEHKLRPLIDRKIMDRLHKKGFMICAHMVYFLRKQLGIPSAVSRGAYSKMSRKDVYLLEGKHKWKWTGNHEYRAIK